ncbi:MAG: energy-coupling factor ABC transporter ATP-binding protein [Clostridiales Family XIII bacterium]|jgi:energy-coupling factor transport system ATP-binding protein|nr:energy-coupling factor ABC transporter ATP-binding protein [Clostridiales Family XIII bacterium]
MISVQNLWFSYEPDDRKRPNPDKKYALRDISLEIDKRPTAIIGQNGAGKTTFVRILKGLLTANRGAVTVMGEDVSRTTAARLARNIGLVFQNPNDQLFKKTVMDEAMFGPLNIGMGEGAARKSVMRALDIMELSDKLDTNPHDLALSDKKLLCIASVMAMDTDIIILDEPTISQDYVGREKVKRVIRLLRDEGKSVMTIIHDMDFVAECFERIIVFNEGEKLLDGGAKEVFSDAEMLKKAHLEPPYALQLAISMGLGEVCLTEADVIRCMMEA